MASLPVLKQTKPKSKMSLGHFAVPEIKKSSENDGQYEEDMKTRLKELPLAIPGSA